ncbi:NYN domain-containing protein, partial [Clostridioides difficile]
MHNVTNTLNINHYLIIDGYNIINAWDNLKELAK